MATRPLKTDLLHRGSAQTSTEDNLQESFQQGALKADLLEESTEELSCEGLEEEECLNRRSLAAHTDYIYTQHHKHP
ncbi:hypothetical protein SUGI_0901950 [Cryptomeria japonica]|nr:hypothetical protein SUGI_0901950 [Cryptomeria japonica]